MFKHIKGAPLTTEELKAADSLLAQGWEQGWIERSHITDEIRQQKKILTAAAKSQK